MKEIFDHHYAYTKRLTIKLGIFISFNNSTNIKSLLLIHYDYNRFKRKLFTNGTKKEILK